MNVQFKNKETNHFSKLLLRNVGDIFTPGSKKNYQRVFYTCS